MKIEFTSRRGVLLIGAAVLASAAIACGSAPTAKPAEALTRP